jgi:hypothetical protein
MRHPGAEPRPIITCTPKATRDQDITHAHALPADSGLTCAPQRGRQHSTQPVTGFPRDGLLNERSRYRSRPCLGILNKRV